MSVEGLTFCSGAFTLNVRGTWTIRDCVFEQNGISVETGNPVQLTMERCELVDNSGNVNLPTALLSCHIPGSFVSISDCVFRGNLNAGGPGGAVRVTSTSSSGPVIFTNTLFEGNESAVGGGAIYVHTAGGAIAPAPREVELVHCSLIGNLAPDGAIAVDTTINNVLDFIAITNSILWNTSVANQITYTGMNAIEVRHSLLEPGSQIDYPHASNLFADPELCSVVVGDAHLFPTSPCIVHRRR